MKSFIHGRVGSLSELTGLFVLDAPLSTVSKGKELIKAVGETKDGFECNSSLVFDKGAAFSFLTSRPYCLSAVPPGAFERDNESLVWSAAKKKIAPKVFMDHILGMLPSSQVIKVILRQEDVKTKRTIMFGLGVPPERGGKTWIVSSHGFNWVDSPRNIITQGDGNFTPMVSNNDFLYLAVTSAVPLISGPVQKQPDEEYPRILWEYQKERDVQEYLYLIRHVKSWLKNTPTAISSSAKINMWKEVDVWLESACCREYVPLVAPQTVHQLMSITTEVDFSDLDILL